MIQLLIQVLILIVVPMEAQKDQTEPKSMSTTTVQSKITEVTSSLDCSFSKLITLIGHNKFSILGMHQNCAMFYILGDNIKHDNDIDLTEIQGSLGRCQSTQLFFYKVNGEYQLLVTQRMSTYVGQCIWQYRSNSYLSCLFDRKRWKKLSIKPSANDDLEIIGHVTDVESSMLHVFYSDENGIFYDSTYNISSEEFIKHAALQQKNLKKLSYDSDRQFMYLLTNEMVQQKVKSNFGMFIYEPTYVKVNNFTRGSYSAFSFSNSYYIVKKSLSDGRIAYYAGKEGNPEQVCVAELLPDETFHMSLFVGADSNSVHERIKNQLAPKPSPTEPDFETTTVPMAATRPSLQTISFILILLLLNIISGEIFSVTDGNFIRRI